MEKILLNGAWTLAEAGKEPMCPVTVPGTVLSGMLEADLIDDPFYRTNEDATRALFRKDYEFDRSFDVSDEQILEDKIVLVCEGLDTLADIYINGTKIAATDNMHRTWKLDVKPYVHSGKNDIKIIFASALKYIDDYKYGEGKEAKFIASGAMKGNQVIRKAHSMFGWDWGPQTIDAGIFRDIYVECYSHPRIDDVIIRQHHGDDVSVNVEVSVGNVTVERATKEDSGNVTGEYAVADNKDNGKYRIRCSIAEASDRTNAADADIHDADAIAHNEISNFIYDKSKETYTGNTDFTIKNPKLWWPNGYGAQPLYTVKAQLVDEDGNVLETVTKRIGLRTLTVSTEADQWGNEFAFCVNGLKIFTMGGNYIPEDCLYTRINRKQQEFLLDSCVKAHFNCVRVWGGGYYPSDEFYDMCDERGLIIWQDMMYACNVYDVTDDFAENCRLEAIDNVKRLRHHAALGLWCGNNEIESAWDHWPDFQKETPYLRADYIKLFEDVLPKAVKQADDQTFYWKSSPSSGGCFDFPDDDTRGDNHYWDVWHGQKPFTDYRKYFFRFCSEFGFQSFPCLKTVESFTEENDRNIFSRVMENHQKNDSANGKMLFYLSENFRYPEEFGQLLYITQVLQGMAIKYGVDHWRRNRGRCMGTLYWQINDNWPVASWASIDYYNRWKGLHYMARRFYAPLAVSMELNDGHADVWLESECLEDKNYSLVLFVKDMRGNVLKKFESEGIAPKLSSSKIYVGDIVEFSERKYDVFVEAVVTTGDGEHLSDVEIMVPYKYLELCSPDIRVNVEEHDDHFDICLTGNGFIPFVEMDFDDADVIFEDNFFHLTGTDTKVIRLYKNEIIRGGFKDADDLGSRLKIRCVR